MFPVYSEVKLIKNISLKPEFNYLVGMHGFIVQIFSTCAAIEFSYGGEWVVFFFRFEEIELVLDKSETK